MVDRVSPGMIVYFDNARAQEELGLAFRPVEESVRDSIEWFRENGYA